MPISRNILAASVVLLGLASAGAATGQETVIYSFLDEPYIPMPDGIQPAGSLTFDAKGNLFGTTTFGGNNINNFYQGGGTVFELKPVAGGG